MVYNVLKDNKTVKLSYTVKDFFLFIKVLGNLHNIPDNVEANPVQNSQSDYCGTFQLYFHENLFRPKKKVKLLLIKIWL